MPLDPTKIRARRESLKLSPTEAAERAGWVREAWARLESGTHVDPKLSTAEKIADALRVALPKILR